MRNKIKHCSMLFSLLAVVAIGLWSCSTSGKGTGSESVEKNSESSSGDQIKSAAQPEENKEAILVLPKSASAENLWQYAGTTIDVTQIPLNGFMSFKTGGKSVEGGLPIKTPIVKEYIDETDFEIHEQNIYASNSKSIILISTLVVYMDSTNAFREKTLLEVLDKSGILLWSTEEQNVVTTYCIIPNEPGNIGVLWSLNYESIEKGASKLFVYNNKGVKIDSISDVVSIAQGRVKEHIYYKKEDRISGFESNSHKLYYYNLISGANWEKNLPIESKFGILPLSDNGNYLICDARKKLFSLSYKGDILFEQVKEEYHGALRLSKDGKYLLRLSDVHNKIFLYDNNSGKLIMERKIYSDIKTKYCCFNSCFVNDSLFAISFYNQKNKISLSYYDLEGRIIKTFDTSFNRCLDLEIQTDLRRSRIFFGGIEYGEIDSI